ncbi:NAD(P)/FAD-dependent oxidoreductase [Streptacidiphilus sp. EB129]|uniref:protoporphyrinogen/coproporphyrinogen oxidase n=1 Tax=Streptacidiphilus sp. EB129 TaxID=3156262 RepID=UPI003518DAB8
MGTDHPCVVVVGAGIAGLTAAFRLQQAGCRVRILESQPPERLGGRMATVGRDGFPVDLGAPLLARRYRRMLNLLAEAGASHLVTPAADELAVLHGGRTLRGRTGSLPRLLSGGLLSTVPLRHRLRLLHDVRNLHRSIGSSATSAITPAQHESTAAYARRRRFPDTVMSHILDPLNATMTLSDPDRTSAATPLLTLAFFAAGNGLFTAPTGTGFVPHALAQRLAVTHHARVTSVEEAKDHVTVVWTSPGDGDHEEQADAVVLAVPPDQLPALWPQLRQDQHEYFASARYAHLLQVTFCLNRPTSETAVVLYAGRHDLPQVAALILQHNLSPDRVGHGRGMVTAYLRDTTSQDWWHDDDRLIARRVTAAVRRAGLLPELDSAVIATHVDRIWPSVLIRPPQDPGLLARLEATTHQQAHRVHLAGADLFGHSTTIGSLTSGEQAAHRVLARLGAGAATA